METEKNFTEEAMKVLVSYTDSVKKALSETELTTQEVEDSIKELTYHIISQCEIRSNSEIISTDLVKASIKKLGDPKTIAVSLQSELDFNKEVNNSEPIVNNSKNISFNYIKNNESGFKFRAGHLSAIYAFFSWFLTAIIIFVVFSIEFIDLVILFPFVYIIAVGILIYTRNIEAYMYNKHLQKFVKPNFHTNILPIIFIIYTYSINQQIPSYVLWAIPLSIIIWLILSSTEYGREYYYELVQSVRNIIKNKK